MAAFHPETLRLLRKTLADLNTQHKADMARLAKMHIESRSLMAEKLRNRIADSVPVMRDLERILPPVHDAGPAPELDKRAQWIADARAMLDLIEANPGLPLPGFSLSAHGMTDSDDTDRAFVDAAAAILGVKPTTSPYAQHYRATVVIGTAEYEVVAIPSESMRRHDEIARLGRAALAAQDAHGAEAGESE